MWVFIIWLLSLFKIKIIIKKIFPDLETTQNLNQVKFKKKRLLQLLEQLTPISYRHVKTNKYKRKNTVVLFCFSCSFISMIFFCFVLESNTIVMFSFIYLFFYLKELNTLFYPFWQISFIFFLFFFLWILLFVSLWSCKVITKIRILFGFCVVFFLFSLMCLSQQKWIYFFF